MEYRYLGNTGIKVSVISLGTVAFTDFEKEEEYYKIFKRATGCSHQGINNVVKKLLKKEAIKDEYLLDTKVMKFKPTQSFLEAFGEAIFKVPPVLGSEEIEYQENPKITPQEQKEKEISQKLEKRNDKLGINWDRQEARRIRGDLSQKELGFNFGMCQGEISRYEQGQFSIVQLSEKGKQYLNFLKSKGYNPFNI